MYKTQPGDEGLRGKAMRGLAAFVASAGPALGDDDRVAVGLVELNGEPPREGFGIVKIGSGAAAVNAAP